MSNVFRELRRRNVFKVAVFYPLHDDPEYRALVARIEADMLDQQEQMLAAVAPARPSAGGD